MFDGLSGRIAAKIMGQMNAAAEREAVVRLDPKPNSRVLVIGFGPGLGLQYLLERPVRLVVGIDPSQVMHNAAAARNRNALDSGRLQLIRVEAANLVQSVGPFDGAIAVHTLQICRPFADTAARLAEVLCAGAPLISITHAWAARKDYGTEGLFIEAITQGLRDAGFAKVGHGRAEAENGKAILLEAIR